MPRGRPPKSAALRAAQGLRSHKAKKPAPMPDPPAAIDPPADIPERVSAPEWLSPAARKLWSAVAPGLSRRGFLQEADAIAFGRYLEWLREYVAMQSARRSSRRKVVTETSSKYAKKMQRIDKLFQALMTLDKRLSEYEDRFGMNPRERMAILSRMASGGHHPPPPPPHGKPLEPGGDPAAGRVITPSVPSSPVGFLSSRSH